MFRWRDDHVISSVARGMKRGMDSEMDAFQVFLECQDHLVAAAGAHVERLILEAFVAAIERCDDASGAASLGRLCDLYALWNMEGDRGWFQEHGRLSSTRSKALIRAVHRLCAEIPEEAGTLVAAFGIPDAARADPIATG